MDRVLTVLTGLEARRRAHPDEEWEVQNWDEHTLRPWEAVSKSLVRWGEQANKLTIYVLLKKFSTGAVFWNTEMKTLCTDFRAARKNTLDKVVMDVRLHEKFDEMQKEQRGKSKLPESAANAKFPLAGEIHDVLKQRLNGAHPMWDEGDCAKEKYTLKVKDGLGDDYGSVDEGRTLMVDALFVDGKTEVTKDEWKEFDFAPFKNEPLFKDSTTGWIFDKIWNNAHDDANGVVPIDAMLTKDDVKKFLHR